jgi:hypothetical protein
MSSTIEMDLAGRPQSWKPAERANRGHVFEIIENGLGGNHHNRAVELQPPSFSPGFALDQPHFHNGHVCMLVKISVCLTGGGTQASPAGWLVTPKIWL